MHLMAVQDRMKASTHMLLYLNSFNSPCNVSEELLYFKRNSMVSSKGTKSADVGISHWKSFIPRSLRQEYIQVIQACAKYFLSLQFG